METETLPVIADEPKPKTSMQFGILIGIISIVLFVVYYALNIPQQGLVGFIPTIIFFILIIVAQQVHAKAVNGNITYGNLFASGFKTTAIAVCINVIFIIIFLIAVPGFKEHAVEAARKKMEARGNLTQDQINAGLAMTRKFFTVFLIAGAVIGGLIVGCIASLIGAGIAKKNPHPVMMP